MLVVVVREGSWFIVWHSVEIIIIFKIIVVVVAIITVTIINSSQVRLIMQRRSVVASTGVVILSADEVVVLWVVGKWPQLGSPPGLTHCSEDLLLVLPSHDSHLLHHHVYLYVINSRYIYTYIYEVPPTKITFSVIIRCNYFSSQKMERNGRLWNWVNVRVILLPSSFWRIFLILLSHPAQSMWTDISTTYKERGNEPEAFRYSPCHGKPEKQESAADVCTSAGARFRREVDWGTSQKM